MKDLRVLALFLAVYLGMYFLPLDRLPFAGPLAESLALTRWYAREHVLLCLVPAFFIAGAIGAFVSQGSVMKYLGARANKAVAYGVASVSGSVLAVCSCTVLPLFAGIHKRGAGLGPAINVLAIILTARVLGVELGIARAVGAIAFSVVIGLIMAFFFRRDEAAQAAAQAALPDPPDGRPLHQTALVFAAMVGVLIFANWGRPAAASGFWFSVHELKWFLTAAFAVLLGAGIWAWFGARRWKLAVGAAAVATAMWIAPDHPEFPFLIGTVAFALVLGTGTDELRDWLAQSWGFARLILPLLLAGVLAAGLLLGRPGHEGLIPSDWVARSVGGNSLGANLFASVAGALMYFATLTEIPILEGLRGAGMGKGPALALLLAGPALSLPNMLVIRSVMGTHRTLVFVGLVVAMSTICGVLFGALP